MAKVNFSARKDPLLRPRRGSTSRGDSRSEQRDEPQRAEPDEDGVEALTAVGRTRPMRSPAGVARPRVVDRPAIEEPAGVISIAPREGAPNAPAVEEQAPDTAEPAATQQPVDRARRAARRVQTSISLPPAVWDTLDELADGAGVANGQLLAAVLAAALPDSPAAAFDVVEELLLSDADDDALHEERNYRLPLPLRADLDALAAALGSRPRPQRSLLIHALIAAHAPGSAEQARQLITAQRIDDLRASMRESVAD